MQNKGFIERSRKKWFIHACTVGGFKVEIDLQINKLMILFFKLFISDKKV